LELWLGEVKFYNDISNAIKDVIEELNVHSQVRYIKNEFVAISNKIDDSLPHSDKLKALLHPNTSLDDVFSATCIPVLLTYNSDVLSKYTQKSQEYIDEISAEFLKFHSNFCNKLGSFPLTIHLFLLPLHTKEELVDVLNSKLNIWQQI
jgi:hypothetical protein